MVNREESAVLTLAPGAAGCCCRCCVVMALLLLESLFDDNEMVWLELKLDVSSAGPVAGLHSGPSASPLRK